MTPVDELLKLLGQLGDSAGDAVNLGLSVAAQSVFDTAMQQIWTSALFVLRNVLEFIDKMSVFTVSTTSGPVSVLWPLMLWISGLLALALFFWQIVVTVLRGGRGFFRLIAGPAQYGVALAAAVGLVAAFLAAADGLTTAVLQYGLHSDKFADALHAMNFPDAASDTIKAAVLGLFGIAGTFPAAFGLGFEMVLREASIYIVVVTIPLLAAGLLARATTSWFWKGCRIILALVFVKPGIALVIVVGVAVEGGAQGFAGLLAGTMILLISLWTPFVLFKLFAFVDPRTESGEALRDALADAGANSYGPDSIPGRLGGSLMDKLKDRLSRRPEEDDDEDGDSDDTQELANVERFAEAGGGDEADDDPSPFDDEDSPSEHVGEPDGEAEAEEETDHADGDEEPGPVSPPADGEPEMPGLLENSSLGAGDESGGGDDDGPDEGAAAGSAVVL
ncbi:hypothetical protein AB0878_45000 [Amycolatopsis sp. NPDC047767]|uniref:hypothetical protein n=1 Tax=Amycolatopsis sp. NPDC047767 TaxID=3156765 RepID=UPI0034544FDD